MSKPYFIVVPNHNKMLVEREDLSGIDSFLREVTDKSDIQEACEQLGAVVTVDITIAQELERMAWTRGYHQAVADRCKPKEVVLSERLHLKGTVHA